MTIREKLEVFEERLKRYENREIEFKDNDFQEETIKVIKMTIEDLKKKLIKEDEEVIKYFNFQK